MSNEDNTGSVKIIKTTDTTDKGAKNPAPEMIDTLTQTQQELTLSDGVVVVVRRAKVRQIGELSKLSRELNIASYKATFASDMESEGNMEAVFTQLMQNNFDTAVKFVTIMTDLTEEQVQDSEIDDFIVLMGAIVSLNVDFFTQRVLPALTKAMESLPTK